MVLYVLSETIRLIRDGRMEVGEGKEGDYTYLSLHCHHQNDSCIKMGSDESHFNVSFIVRDKSHNTVSTDHNIFEERGEPKRNRAKALLLTSLTPYRWATPALCLAAASPA